VTFQIGPELPLKHGDPFLSSSFIVILSCAGVTTHYFEVDKVDIGENTIIHDIMHCFVCNSGDPPRCLKTHHTASNCYVFVTNRVKDLRKSKSDIEITRFVAVYLYVQRVGRKHMASIPVCLFLTEKPNTGRMSARTVISF
jgi:hypothetical protein